MTPAPARDYNHALHCADDREAFSSLLRAAEGGCVRAQFLLGLAYHTGRGIGIDYQLAGAWYQKAAAAGDRHAIANLGVMSLLGQGAPPDDLEAYTWIRSAVGLGHEQLRPALVLLERRIAGKPDLCNAGPILAALQPEEPVLVPCARPGCDPSRCESA